MSHFRLTAVQHGKRGSGGPPRGETGAASPARLLAVTMVMGMVMALGLPALGVAYKASDIPSPDGLQAGDRWGERTDVGQFNVSGREGDDVQDVVVGVFNHDADVDGDGTAEEDVGRVYTLDGSTLAGSSQTQLYQFDIPNPQTNGVDGANFGFYVAVIGDVGGADDAEEIAVGAPGLDVGKAWVFDGANGDVLRELENPDGQSGQRFGARLGVAGDQNGDGHNDIIVGAPTTDVGGNSNVGRAYVVSPKDADGDGEGDHLFTLDNPDDQAGAQFGKSVQGVGDLGSMDAAGDPPDDPEASEDGYTDLYVNAFRHTVDGDERGRSYVFSAGDDFDGDDLLDEKELLTKLDSPEPQESPNSAPEQGPGWFGIQEVKPNAPGDIAGDGGSPDGTPDLYGASFRQDVVDDPGAADDDDSCDDPTLARCNENEGKAWVFDGAASIQETSPSDGLHGVTLYQLTDPQQDQPGSSFGWSLSTTEFPEDTHAFADLYVGQIPHPHEEGGPLGGNGGTYIFDGEDAQPANSSEGAGVHKKLELPSKCQQSAETGNRPPALGWTNSTLQDVDSDDKDDYVAGAPWTDLPDKTGTQDAGLVIFFGSNSNKTINDCS